MTVSYRSRGLVIGLDLGQRVDATAIVIVEKLLPVGLETDTSTWPSDYKVPTPEIIFRVRELGRLPLGTDYVTVAKQAAEVVHNVNCADLEHAPRFFADATGVGSPVVDALDRFMPTGVTAVRVQWSSGAKVVRNGREVTVGKGWIVSRLQALLDTGRLQVPDTPEATALLDELMSFQITISETGTVKAGAKSGKHDDLVMALALCVIEDDSPQIAYGGPVSDPLEPTYNPGQDWEDLHRAPSDWFS